MPDVKYARECLETLASKYRQMADALQPAIDALKEAEDAQEYAVDRRASIEAARGLLTPEAIAALDLGAPAAKPRQSERKRQLMGPQGVPGTPVDVIDF